MHYHLQNIDERLTSVFLKLSCYSLNNTLWSCMYSGAGIIDPNAKRDEEWPARSSNAKLYEATGGNHVPVKCIYKKAKPIFSKSTQPTDTFSGYLWDQKNFNKVVSPDSQAFAILSLCLSARTVYNDSTALGVTMIHDAETYYEFTTTYLRDIDGLFISVEDKTKRSDNELRIKVNQKTPKPLDQFYIHEAFLMLNKMTSSDLYPEYKSEKASKYLSEARGIFAYLFDNYNSLLELSSKEISLCISSLSRCCSVEDDSQMLVNFNHIIALLCAEMENRIKITGEVERNFNDFQTSSMITHFRAASSLMEGYFETGIEKFKDLSLRVFRFLEDLYDPSTGFFVKGDGSEVYYSVRDIAEILRGLILYYTVGKKDKIYSMINNFYMNSLESSGIIQSSPFRSQTLLGNNIDLSQAIPLMDEYSKAPVFLKSFRITYKKVKTLSVSKHYSSFYSLYSGYMFMHYLTPFLKPGTNKSFNSSSAL